MNYEKGLLPPHKINVSFFPLINKYLVNDFGKFLRYENIWEDVNDFSLISAIML